MSIPSKPRPTEIEQNFADWAYRAIKMRLENLRRAENPGADSKARNSFEKNRKNRQHELNDPPSDLIIGRIYLPGDGDFRIGRIGVSGDADPKVLDWRAPKAKNFFLDPRSARNVLTFRRTIVMKRRKVVSCEDDIGVQPKDDFSASPGSSPILQSPGRLRPNASISTSSKSRLASNNGIQTERSSDKKSHDKTFQPNNAGTRAPLAGELGRSPTWAERLRAPETLQLETERPRTGRMQGLLETLQPDQFDLVSQPANQSLIVEGGPGSGKTVVALHRIAYLLYEQNFNHDEHILVVGPTENWVAYLSTFLHSLAIESEKIQKVSITTMAGLCRKLLSEINCEVAPSPPREEPGRISELKGRSCMFDILSDYVWGHAVAQDQVVKVGEFEIAISEREMCSFITKMRSDGVPYRKAQWNLWKLFWEKLDLLMFRKNVPHERKVMLNSELLGVLDADKILDLAFPTIGSLRGLLRDFLRQQENLMKYCTRHLAEDEIQILSKFESNNQKTFFLSDTDLYLLSALGAIVHGSDNWKRIIHLVVDEAQDLSPLQWRFLGLIGKKNNAGKEIPCTLIGDLAQKTSSTELVGWESMAEAMGLHDAKHHRLERSYRIPGKLNSAVAKLQGPRNGPDNLESVTAEGEGLEDVKVMSRSSLGQEILRIRLSRGGLTAVTGTHQTLQTVAAQLRAEKVKFLVRLDGAANSLQNELILLPVNEMKGLEFDNVLILEPEELVKRDKLGNTALYIALTRATKSAYFIRVNRPSTGIVDRLLAD